VSPDVSNHGTAPTTWVNPKDGQKYVWIVPGSFRMGCSASDSECKDNEKPAHRVEIPTGFWLGQTEVTNEAHRRVAPSKASGEKEEPSLPVRGLSWPEAKAYCIATGGRLPTEAEWEYAARGGSSEPYYGVPYRIAWYANNSGGVPHPVGMKEPNAFGLYDVLGNVSEWVLDRYYNKYDLEADATGPHIDQPLSGNSSAIVRGGFWDAELAGIRVSHRAEQLNDQHVETAGVRCANDHH
jgi:formylglycine-generating enzyme required for sulfatase activity